MANRSFFSLIKIWLLAIFSIGGMLTNDAFGQTTVTDGDLSQAMYTAYQQKAKQLLLSSHIHIQKSIFAAVITEPDKTAAFEKYLGSRTSIDHYKLMIKIGKGEISTKQDLEAYVQSQIRVYATLYADFKRQEADNQQKQLGGSNPVPFSPGQPCNNMDFGTHDMTGWTGSWGSSQDPTATASPDVGVINSTGNEHTIMTGGADGIIPSIPRVRPGATASIRLGEEAGGGLYSARMSQTFMVNPASPYFTYNYAAVIQDGAHTAAIQPYLKIRMYIGVNNSGTPIDCASLDINGTSAAALGLSSNGSYFYKNWTQVLIPLNSYAGQNVTIEFTVSDCMGSTDISGNPAPGSHDAWAYIDCSCTPPQILTSSPTICGGSSINVSAPTGLASYSWTGPGIVGASNGATIAANVAGTYTVTMQTVTTPPNAPCTFSLDTVIPGNPFNPVANFTSDVVCQGSATTFTDSSTPAGSISAWAWDFDANASTDATTQNPTHTFPGAGSFPVTLTVTSGTCTNSYTANVTVNPGVSPTITAAGPFCVDAAATTLTGNPTGGTWSGTGITNTATGVFTPSAATVGNNTITYSVTGACAGNTTSTIVVNPLPVSDAGTDVTICSGTAATIGSPNTVGYTYSWAPAAGLSSAIISNPSITTVNNGTVPIVTNYTVTTTANTCTSTDAVTVTVNPQPVLAITNPAAVCTPNTVDLTAAAVTAGSTGGGVFTYWTDAAATAPLATPAAVATSGTYYIKVTATGGCTDIAPVTVTINPLPVSNAGPDITICTGTPATLGTATTAGYGYSWSPATGLSSSTISNPDNTTTNAGTTSIVTTYTVTTTITATGCQSADTAIVTVNPFPVLATTNPAAVCAPSTVDITLPAVTAGSIGAGVLSYWLDAAATNPLLTPTAVAASGTYYIKIVSGAGCSDLDSVVVTINPLPVSNAGPDLVLCTGGTGPIGTPTTAGDTYSWTPGTGLSSTTISDPTVTLTNLTLSPVSTSYAVTTTITATGCLSHDTVIVTVNPVATANAGSSQSVCSGSSLTLAGAVGGAASGGTWSGGAGTYTPDNATLNAVYTPSAAEYAAGSVTLTLTTNDPTGPCTFASSSVTFFFYENPVIAFTVDDPNGCPVHCGAFTDLSTIGGGDNIVSWDWNFGDGSAVDSTTQNTSHCFTQTGFYDVSLTATSNHGCISTLTNIHMVQVYATPVADFNPNPTNATVLNPVVTLENASSPDVNYWNYYFGDGDSISPSTSSPVHTYPNGEASSYLATLIVHNADGCWDTIRKPVDIGPEFTFYIPNAFTPNGDGVNDYFFGQGIGIVDYDIYIFDRWGNMIYHGDNIYASKWDGKANHGSDVAQQDVYVWKVKLKDVFGKTHNYIGTVTLVR